ncbi:hypothetical protein [Noviherbaspirillum autotrophicum]|uniref:hypothetical protein n=1 Tax=Noviherbaspirillum autotrophicum TaxID=709839 RepID=UPI0012FE6001|nr:hypothetical protein [Noviherbaspirillum autotrophicum]
MTSLTRATPTGLLRAASYALFLFLAGLAGCGGGGDGTASSYADPQSQPNTALTTAAPNAAVGAGTPPSLLISEVASNYYSDDVAWFEVYNPNATPVLLSDYTLNSSYLDTATGASALAPAPFALPGASVPPHGYLVVASKVHDKLRDSSQMVYVKSGTRLPYWNGSGSLELTAQGRTVDFVRFGNSSAAPATASEWAGPSVAALPSGANEHGKSIVRLAANRMADTNSAADWTLVNFATPAGTNDVPAGVVDSDHDGIPDSAKAPGATYAGIDLYAMGARAGRRDLFMEIDYMQGSDPALTPRFEALQKVVDAFAAKNIALHVDTGKLYSDAIDAQRFNLGGGEAVEFAKCIELDVGAAGARTGCTSFYDYKSAHFDVRRRLAFHYALFASSQNLDGSAGSSGVAELLGNDVIVTLGGYNLGGSSAASQNMLINLQAGTLMHEFGHNLGLRHGGNEDANYKPNHYSVMNYMYQFAGLSAAPDSATAAERYYLANGLKGKTYCNLSDNSPCSSDFIIGYSDGSGADLDERALSEAANIGRGSSGGAYADWDNNNALTAATVARNLNAQDGSTKGVLKDYNEWGNLTLPFARVYAGSNSGAALDSAVEQARPNPMNQRPLHHVVEEPLPASLHAELRDIVAACDRRWQ